MSLTIIFLLGALILSVRLLTIQTMRAGLLLGLGFYLAATILFVAALPIAKVDGGSTSELARQLVNLFTPFTTKLVTALYLIAFGFVWILKLKRLSKQTHHEELLWNKQLIWAVTLIAVLFFGVFGSLSLAARYATGFLGEFSKLLVGFFSSPLFMEFGIFSCGFILIYTFNTLRRMKEGDDFIEMEIPQHVLNDLRDSKTNQDKP